MFIDLMNLDGFYYQKEESYATVNNGIMRFHGSVSYERVTIDAAYKKHGMTCAYCGKPLTKKSRSIEHKYPKIYGGVTLLDNLVPACMDCNEDKGSLLYDEFIEYLSIESLIDRKKFRRKCMLKHQQEVIQNGFCLPREWVVTTDSEVYAKINPKEDYKGTKRYKEIEKFYIETGLLPRPIIRSNNDVLVDGFNILMVAKNNNIRKIPTIIIQNLIVEY